MSIRIIAQFFSFLVGSLKAAVYGVETNVQLQQEQQHPEEVVVQLFR